MESPLSPMVGQLPVNTAMRISLFPSSRTRRLAFVLIASIALHLLLLGVVPDLPRTPLAVPSPLTATLVPQPEIPAPKPKPPGVQPHRQRQAPPRPPTPTISVAAPPVASAPVAAMTAVVTPDPVAPDAVPAADLTTLQANQALQPETAPQQAPSNAASSAEKPALPLAPADPPTSATLRYDVVAKDPRTSPPGAYYGVGTVTWNQAQGRYQADLKADVSVLFLSLTVLNSHSEGTFDAHGLAPDRYSETPRNRATMTTVFHREPGQSSHDTISFSGSPATSDLHEGTQDRLSILVQVGALLRSNPALNREGRQFEVPVAGVHGEAEVWNFVVRGQETIPTGLGPLSTVHVARQTRPGSNDREIELWIALDEGGYPAKIRYTEPNTTFIDMTLARLDHTSPQS